MFGHHRDSCARSGEEKSHINVPAEDSRNIEVLAQGLPCHGGVQLAVDITFRSALSCDGQAHPHAADHDGSVLSQARRDKETTYPELASSGRCKLVVLAIETGGRWSEEAVQTMKMLAHSKARDAQSYMQFPVAFMWERRWTRIVGRGCGQQLKREPEDKMDDLDVNTLICGMFMIVTLLAAVHLGNDFLEN